ncbi:MAG: hypothetical protein LIP01_09890 [Tannerellaceae bacterium]|nr:hypothetical protein [Tannerellaceae bacterium]
MITATINKIYTSLLSEKRKLQVEHSVYGIALIMFVVHFVLVLLINQGFLPVGEYFGSGKTTNVVSTIYTPFTIILLYEVYLLVYYLPHSINIYLGKQYEIAALIIIRGLFEKLAHLPVDSPDFGWQDMSGVVIAFGVLILILLFLLLFYRLTDDKKQPATPETYSSNRYYNYIIVKRGISIILLFLFLFLLVYSLSALKDFEELYFDDLLSLFKGMNRVFFSAFFDALIITEVLLLLCMYHVSDGFDKVIRNSGFILSTILLKLSFRTTGLRFIYIVLIAVLFGVAISAVYRLYQRWGK